VQVYFENPKVEQALRREARAARIPLSRAAERAIGRGLVKRPTADPEDRLLKLERSLRDHMPVDMRRSGSRRVPAPRAQLAPPRPGTPPVSPCSRRDRMGASVVATGARRNAHSRACLDQRLGG